MSAKIDSSGNGVQPPVAPVSDDGLTFPNFFSPLNPPGQPSLRIPVPCEFINSELPEVLIIRPITDRFGCAAATAQSLTADGLFTGHAAKRGVF